MGKKKYEKILDSLDSRREEIENNQSMQLKSEYTNVIHKQTESTSFIGAGFSSPIYVETVAEKGTK